YLTTATPLRPAAGPRPRSAPWSSLVVVEAGLGELRLDRPADQVADERARGVGLLALLRDAGRVDRDLLEVLGQGADQRHALDGKDPADLVHDDLGLALDDGFRRVAARPQDRLALHCVGDAEPLEHRCEVDAARRTLRRIDVDERLRRQQRLLEGLG